MNEKNYEKGIADYLASPKPCKNCSKPIPLVFWRNRYWPSISKRRTYCNHACAASYTGHAYPKRKPQVVRQCQECKRDIVGVRKDRNWKGSYHKPYHPECYKTVTERALEQPISSVKDKTTITCMARNFMIRLFGPDLECWVCGYAKIVETCHIKAIKDFPPTTLLKVVNDIDNLLLLCPNHHKELDRHMMAASEVKRPQAVDSVPPLNASITLSDRSSSSLV